MDNQEKSPHTPKMAVNLKHLPPIEPNSSSKFKLKSSSTIASATKMVKPNSNNPMKLVNSAETIVVDAEEKSLISCNKDSETLGKATITPDNEGMKKGYGRSKLYEICAANHWKPPVFECCKEEGPCHCRMFTFKVVIEIKISEESKNIIEVYGAPHQKKKMAADDAAEGALWYLKHIGFVMKKK